MDTKRRIEHNRIEGDEREKKREEKARGNHYNEEGYLRTREISEMIKKNKKKYENGS